MGLNETTAVVLRESRFVTDPETVRELLPGIDAALPPLTLIEYVDGIPRTALGWPVHASGTLTRELFRFCVTSIGRALSDSDPSEADDLTLSGVKGEPYFAALSGLLARCLAHGPELRLDTVLWLSVSRFVARLLTRDDTLLQELRARFPDDVAKATQYLDELLRVKGSSPSRHAAVKGRVLAGLLARHDIALGAMSEATADGGLHRLLADNRLVWTEQPDGLYSFFDLREAFLTRHRGFGLQAFLDRQTFVRCAVDEAWRKRASGGTSLQERWLLEEFVSEPLLERASRLDLAGLADAQEDDYPARVAVIASLQPPIARYVLHHAELFQPSRGAAKRFDLSREQIKRFKDAGAMAAEAGRYVNVVEDVLRWDVLNTTRGFVRDVDSAERGWMEGTRRVRASARVLDLNHPGTVFSRRRHGTLVAWELVGFEDELRARTLPESEASATEDFESLCLRRLLSARERLAVGGGRPDSFHGGLGMDLFPRALDALRYALSLQAAVNGEQTVQLGLDEEPVPNPFARAVRIGIASADYIDVMVPSQRGAPQGRAIGEAADSARALAANPGAPPAGRIAIDEYDPLEVFRATVVGSELINHGCVSNERAFKEILASVRLDGMTHSAADRDAVIAGRAVEFKNYAFELVFDDPVSRQVVLVRRIAEPHKRGGVEAAVFEYVAMTVEEFVSFNDRAADAARHQPVVRRTSRDDDRSEPPAAARRSQTRPQKRPPKPPPPSAPSVPDLAIPDAAAFMVGTSSSSQDVLGGKLGLSFDAPAEDSQGFLAGLFGEQDAAPSAAWPPSEGWLSESSSDLGGDAASAGLKDDFTALVGDPTPPDTFAPLPPPDPPASPLPEPDFSFADSALDDFSLGDPRPAPELPDDGPSGALFDFGGDGLSAGFFETRDPTPPPRRASRPGAPIPSAPESLLGVLDAGFLERLAHVAPDVAPQVASRKAKSRTAPRPEQVRVVRPDFATLFKDYVIFDIGDRSEVAIGRRYKDVLFDLHRFPRPAEPGWVPDRAVDAFMRAKVRDNFVPRSLSYDEVPAGAGPLEPLTLESLERAFDRVT